MALTPGLPPPAEDLEDLGPPVPLAIVLALFGAALVGALGAAWLLPAWAPALAQSLDGADGQAAWFLSRASGLVAFVLVAASMVFGLLLGTRFAKAWPGAQAAFALHQHTSLLGLAFGLFHALVLLGDRYLHPSLLALAIPFGVSHPARLAIGSGQLAFLLGMPVALSFWAKQRLGHAAWKRIHLAAFAVFALALGHGLFAGSDTSRLGVSAVYFVTGGAVLFLTLVQALTAALSTRSAGSSPALRG